MATSCPPSSLVAILEKSSDDDSCWFIDLEAREGTNKLKDALVDAVDHHWVVFKDAKSFLGKLQKKPTPYQKIICLSTIKKLLAYSPDDTVAMPEFSSAHEAFLWMEKKLNEAFDYIKKIGLDEVVKLECQVISATLAMEEKGIPFDKERWQKELDDLEKDNQILKIRLKGLLKKDHGFLLFGEESVDLNNNNEVKQSLETLLERKLSGTSQSSLEDIDHEAVKLLLLYREQARMLTNYGENFLKKIHNERLRGHFVTIGSASGRFSCHDPNLLALPRHSSFQACMKPKVPAMILCFDYGAFELRILSALSGDEKLMQIFNDGEDIHSLVAQEIFKTTVSKTENNHLRDQAKVLNFGLIYGMGEVSLARKLKITEKDAKILLNNYFKRFKKVHQFLNDLEKQAHSTGYVSTALGRRADVLSSNSDPGHKARVAKNIPIQGTGADIVKLALCRVFKRLFDEKLDAHVINVIHDELVVECHEKIIDEVRDLVRTEMTEAFTAILPNMLPEVCVAKGAL